VDQELDSHKGQLRHMQTLTSKATVMVNYAVPYQDVEVKLRSIGSSFKKAAALFVDNVAMVIEFIGAALPWLPVVFAGFWVVVRLFRFAFAKGAASLMFWKK
jgi:hypothetical protein